MTKQYKFFLRKFTHWVPRCKYKEKSVIIKARSVTEAYSFIDALYPNWEVSMFWPIV